MLEQLRGLTRAHRSDTNEAHRARHEQRGRNAVARYVPHANEDAPLVDEEHIEEVATNFRGGSRQARELDIAPLGEQPPARWQHAGLKLPRDLQLPAHVFEREMPPLRFEHRLVRSAHSCGQRPEQVARYTRYAGNAAPEPRAWPPQHAYFGDRDHPRGDGLAVDGRHFPDAFADVDRNGDPANERSVE